MKPEIKIHLNQALALCSKSEKCTYDIEQFLQGKRLVNNDINDIIDLLKAEKFIN